MLHIQVAGTAYERGYRHGQSFSSLIGEHVAQYQLSTHWDDEKQRVIQTIQQNLASQLPDLLEEIEGIADGAAIPLSDLIALNYWIEVLQATTGYGCSLVAFANTTQGVIVGKNSDHDLAAARYLALQVVSRDTRQRSHAFMRGTFVGTTSTRAGINSAGLAVCGAALVPHATNWDGVPVMALIGHILSCCASVSEAVDVARSLPVINYGANILVGDHTGSTAVIERMPYQFAVRHPDGDVIFNTNHCLAEETIPGIKLGIGLLENSQRRYAKLAAQLPDTSRTPVGMQRLLRDHTQPGAICQHGRDNLYTCASYIMVPRASKMLVADGCPCAVSYEEFELESTAVH